MKKERCSSLPRRAMCPGSRAAEEGLQSEDSAVSMAGTAGHAALEAYYGTDNWMTFPISGLAPNQQIDAFLDGLDDMTASRAKWYANVMDGIIESHGGAVEIHTEVEMSVMMRNGFGEVELTGHCDLVVICADGETLISDWKFNFLEVPEAAHNIQLMGYALLAIKDPRVPFSVTNKVHTILIAGGNDNPFTAAVYSPDNTDKLEKHILSILSKSFAEDARRCPSDDGCKYCLASGTSRCPERLAEISSVPALTQAYEVMPGKEDCLRLFKAVKTVESFGRKFMKDLKECVEKDPEGWSEFFELSNTGSTRTIKDAQAAYSVFVEKENLCTHEEFMATMSVAIGKLEDTCKPALKERDVKVKDQKKHIETLLGENLEKKEKAKSLKVVKK